MDRRSVAVFGTGVMARGIAMLCLGSGFNVVLLSSSLQRAEELRRALLEQVPGADVSTDRSGVVECHLILEATVEDRATKRSVLEELEPLAADEAVMASTTSSLSITELASTLRRPERMVGIHFFNPVHRMPLVEIVAGLRTDPEAVRRARDFAHAVGKRPLTVPDGAGFLVNRLLIPYLNQAARLAESGYAAPEDVDRAMVIGAGHPMGPFALMDLIGLDVCVAIGRSLEAEYHRTSDGPTPEMLRRVSTGWLGRKSGRGYFDYPPKASAG